MYINGEWCEAATGARFSVTNPATGDIIDMVPDGGEADTIRAVDAAHAAALAAGATSLKTPEKVFWGGYSGYYADPDGHVREVAMNPFAPLNEDSSWTLTAPE